MTTPGKLTLALGFDVVRAPKALAAAHECGYIPEPVAKEANGRQLTGLLHIAREILADRQAKGSSSPGSAASQETTLAGILWLSIRTFFGGPESSEVGHVLLSETVHEELAQQPDPGDEGRTVLDGLKDILDEAGIVLNTLPEARLRF